MQIDRLSLHVTGLTPRQAQDFARHFRAELIRIAPLTQIAHVAQPVVPPMTLHPGESPRAAALRTARSLMRSLSAPQEGRP